MKKVIPIFAIAFATFLVPSLGFHGVHAQEDCIDSSLIDSNSICTTVYEPVCGCDGVTYSNSCDATIRGGVTSYVEGKCCN